jgi:glycosyltransferase involved in cell wall biosynthesis
MNQTGKQPPTGDRLEEHQSPLFSAIVPCLGHAGELRRCLAGLTGQEADFPYEIIVANSAADPDVSAVVAEFPGVRQVQDAEGRILWPSAARNLGSDHARGRYLAFTDADCVPESGWLAAARESLQAGARLTGGPVLDLLPWHPIAAIDNLLQFADFPAGRPDGSARYFPGCNLAIRRDDLLSAGGFPDDVGGRSGDALFSTLARKHWPGAIYFKQQMRVRHQGRSSLGIMWRHQKAFGQDRAQLRIQLKPIHQRLGRHALSMPLVMGKRLSYIVASTRRWHPAGLIRIVVFFTILAIGLLAWSLGFYQGMKKPLPMRPDLDEKS